MFVNFEEPICCAECNEEIENGELCYHDDDKYICVDCIDDYAEREFEHLSTWEKADKLGIDEIEDVYDCKLHKSDYHKEAVG